MSRSTDTDARGFGTAKHHVAGRYALASLGGFLVNLMLFALMQALIAPGKTDTIQRQIRPVFEFLRLKRDESTEVKTRRQPEKKRAKPSVASAPLAIAKSTAPSSLGIAVNPGEFKGGLAMTGRPFLGLPGGEPGGEGDGSGDGSGVGADTDAVPLVRVNPLYPPRAQSRGIQGWVLVEFTVTKQGLVENVVVVDADPDGYFEKAAVNAVQKYRYKPRFENGVAVDRPGVRLVISFALQE